jgi:hypothetical protein
MTGAMSVIGVLLQTTTSKPSVSTCASVRLSDWIYAAICRKAATRSLRASFSDGKVLANGIQSTAPAALQQLDALLKQPASQN